MKNKFFALGLVVLGLIGNTQKMNAQTTYPKFGLGFQASFPAAGLSAKADLSEQHTAQVVVGVFGPFQSYYGRYAYNFSEKISDIGINYKPYVFGQIGYYEIDFGKTYGRSNILPKSTSIGYGAGAGFEWYFEPFSENLKFNAEIGYSKVNLQNYDFNSIMFGAGVHYYFNL
jgi:hypothetical protein